jgi:hypothetical protein
MIGNSVKRRNKALWITFTAAEGDFHRVVLLVHPKILELEILFNAIPDVEPLLPLVWTCVFIHYTVVSQYVDEPA